MTKKGVIKIKAILLSAGYGKRLWPLTWFKPKQFVKINGKTVIERNIEYLNKYGIHDIIVNIHYKPDYFIKHLGDKVLYSYEPKLLGEEKTIEKLRNQLDDTTFVMNSDTLTNVDLDYMLLIFALNDNNVTVKFMDKKTYAGIKIIPKHKSTEEVEYKSRRAWWVDCGTWSGIRKAKKLV